jgi:hypothetical protein
MARGLPRIHFVLDPRATRWPDIRELAEDHVDRMPARFVGGRNSWIAQTFVRLRAHLEARGWSATAGPGFPAGAVCVAHRDDVNRFGLDAHRSFLVVVRADRAPAIACDLAIVQNGLSPGARERFLPLWPQPGLAPRDERRGTRIERVAYHGRATSSPAWFHDPGFAAALRRRGIAFEPRAHGWEDYREVDVAIAARDELDLVLRRKPATKLYNAWLAGVPLLASPEPAYEELRRKPVDYIRIRGADDALRALDALRADPRLYRAMVDNGRERGAHFSVAAVRERWLKLLEDDVLPAYVRAAHRAGSRRAWFLLAMAGQKALSRVHRVRRTAQAYSRSARRAASMVPGLPSSLPVGEAAQVARSPRAG